MARKHRRSHRRSSSHLANRRRRRGGRRSFLRNPPSSRVGELLMAVAAGAFAYTATRAGATYGSRWLPAKVPPAAREAIAAAASGLVVGGASFFALRRMSPLVMGGAMGGSAIPFTEAALNATPIGMKIGTVKTILIQADPKALPAPGVAARLGATLRAQLAEAENGRGTWSGIY